MKHASSSSSSSSSSADTSSSPPQQQTPRRGKSSLGIGAGAVASKPKPQAAHEAAGVSPLVHTSMTYLPRLLPPADAVLTVAYIEKTNRIVCYMRNSPASTPQANSHTTGLLNIATILCEKSFAQKPLPERFRTIPFGSKADAYEYYIVTPCPEDFEQRSEQVQPHVEKRQPQSEPEQPQQTKTFAVSSSSSSDVASQQQKLPDTAATQPQQQETVTPVLPAAVPSTPAASVATARPSPSPHQLRCAAIATGWRTVAKDAAVVPGYVNICTQAFCF